jgi:hypothetical protein
MHRNGIFVPKQKSTNQCKTEGHQSYNYTLSMVFPHTVMLDKDKFIIDHQHVDRLIQSLHLKGSCEQMQQKICTGLRELYKRLNLELLAYKCRIIPDATIGAAYLDYVYVKSDEYNHLIGLF